MATADRLISAATIGWCCAFVLLLAYWVGAEVAEPGQQYAAPWLPCAAIAWFLGALPGMFVASITVRRR